MHRHVIENAYYAGGARFPPSTVSENGSSPQTRDASRSTIKTQTAVVNSATSLFSQEKSCFGFLVKHIQPQDEFGQNIQMRGACLSGRVYCWMSATHTTAHQNA